MRSRPLSYICLPSLRAILSDLEWIAPSSSHQVKRTNALLLMIPDDVVETLPDLRAFFASNTADLS